MTGLLAARLFFGRPLVAPGIRVVLFLLLVPAGKDAAQIFGIAKILADDHGRIRIVLDVLAEVLVILQRVMNQSAQEENVGAGTQGYPDIGHRRGAGEARVDVNNGGAAFTRCHDPLEAHRMVFGHRRSHDKNRVSIFQVGQCGGGAAAAQRCAQTGHGGAVSYPGLVADANHAQASAEQFLDQVVFFVIQSRPAQVGDRLGVHYLLAILLLDEGPLTALP